MPEDLVLHIKSLPPIERNQVWVSCKGHRAADEENVRDIKYESGRGFPGYYYPFKNIPGYLSPIIPIQITAASM